MTNGKLDSLHFIISKSEKTIQRLAPAQSFTLVAVLSGMVGHLTVNHAHHPFACSMAIDMRVRRQAGCESMGRIESALLAADAYQSNNPHAKSVGMFDGPDDHRHFFCLNIMWLRIDFLSCTARRKACAYR
ncbi:MAG: hypothetical protein ABF889_09760 [Bifidobacterium sp.]|uniref:hypothetical protein n=1 Tax=Bifidobacterium sp. TaxID=41200 RepID=UPI0039E98897